MASGQAEAGDAAAPYWERMAERAANVAAFCELMGLATREAVEEAKAFARIGRLERQYGAGVVAEALFAADLKHAESPFESVGAALRYVTGTARGMRERAEDRERRVSAQAAAAGTREHPQVPRPAAAPPARQVDLVGNAGAYLVDQEELWAEVRRRAAQREAAGAAGR